MNKLFIGMLNALNRQDSWWKEYVIAHGDNSMMLPFNLNTGAFASVPSIYIAEALSAEIKPSQSNFYPTVVILSRIVV